MIYTHVGKTCFTQTTVHSELCNGVLQLRLQHCSPILHISTCSSSIRLLSSFFIVVFPCGLDDMLMFSSCNPNFFAVRHIHYPANQSRDHLNTYAVVPSSDHCRTETVLPPGDHYCFDTVAPSGDHCCIDIVVSSSDHCCTDTVPPSSDRYGTTKVAPPSDPPHIKIT